MPKQEEQLDERLAIQHLNEALESQYRSALQYLVVAAELDGVRRLIEKIVSFGGEPTTKMAALRFHAGTQDALADLVECEEEAIEALQVRKQEQVDFMRRATG